MVSHRLLAIAVAVSFACGGSPPPAEPAPGAVRAAPESKAEEPPPLEKEPEQTIELGEPPPPPPPPATAGNSKSVDPKAVPNKLLEAKRISGVTQVQPDNETKIKINASGKSAITTFKLCISREGVPTSVKALKNSGYPGYDAKLAETMKDWRYEPFKVEGKAVPVCTAVTFIYKPVGKPIP